MGAYIVDFVCHGTRIVVEVDGETHDFASRLRRDAVRDAWLASRGYNVLRFTNEDVLRNLEGVLLAIREKAFGGSPPSLSLPRKGGGNPQTATEQASTSSRRRRATPR
jgi:very-short-patch-repair endonuclease